MPAFDYDSCESDHGFEYDPIDVDPEDDGPVYLYRSYPGEKKALWFRALRGLCCSARWNELVWHALREHPLSIKKPQMQ